MVVRDWEVGTTQIYMNYVTKRVITHNGNCIIIFTGGTGSGKSYGAIRVAEWFNPDFDVFNHMCFDPRVFMNALHTHHHPRGRVIICDEAGIQMDSRDSLSNINKIQTKILQMKRFRNQIIIFTLPHIDWMDIKARKLAHLLIHCDDKTIGNPEVKAIGDNVFGESWNPRLQASVNGEMLLLKRMRLELPLLKNRRIYEMMKQSFDDKMRERSDDQFNSRDDEFTPRLTKMQYDVYKGYVLDGLMYKDVAKKLGIDINNVGGHLQGVYKKVGRRLKRGEKFVINNNMRPLENEVKA